MAAHIEMQNDFKERHDALKAVPPKFLPITIQRSHQAFTAKATE